MSEKRVSAKDFWVICPAYNEAGRIEGVLKRLLDDVSHIVVVDDGSADETCQQVIKYPVWLINHPVNLGQGAALQTGLDFALSMGAHYVATFDSDGQHDVSDLMRMLSELKRYKVDYVLGSRFLGEAYGMPLSRKWMLKAGILFTWLLSGVRLTDVHNGIRVMTRRGAEALNITMNRMEHASQLIDQIVRSGFRFTETPVKVLYTPETLNKGQRTSALLRMAVKLALEKVIR